MAQVKNLNQFHKAIVNVKKAAHTMRLELERTEAWYETKDKYYKFSKKGQEWPKHLFEVRQLVEAIEDLEFVGRKFNISYGELVLLKTKSYS
ncbi:hypothetical protein DIU31_005755 [Mucilaginibacter rubeus]|uniref:Uncharacterized protein n=1 Tax=Mucilaginibacter rubeus TaxID=2027860 RepID=A0AAE6JDY2_9SPHI|nr:MULTISPECIES: hypothetical protein [Mucilaginibacter]QEM03047.1 hypothetical protein DIU31_005755 [Mucilaginibacter rubeus]QEM15666.1 hypothetical protein DIU38_005820 [Mucilaginibacter gossypii]QTE41600.1 hypothetical protein J3L19_21980 [Mucilaginibacter rubeus]QTE48205.1 hypothetical protein J3L21_21970 [Mucilaginibacter rubeus]QTE59594.1 hypothetical protein J3L23_13610 [Mucilaginibacter rubeus]